ncbi:MAG: hypothetical protein IVW54_16215 [Candidatus Binataceae bacterium]|nr:hypothetical protein [Candidatus Binataceae bacterium]
MAAMQANDRIATLALGSVRTPGQARHVIELLQAAGFPPQDLSAISPDDELIHEPKIASDHKAGSDPADEKPRRLSNKLKSVIIGGVTGGFILGAVGGLIGLASYAVPSLGLTFSSPMAAALVYGVAGGAAGVACGALLGMRIPDHKTKQQAVDARARRTIVSVRIQSPDASQRAMNILAEGGAEDLHEVVETSAIRDSQLNS